MSTDIELAMTEEPTAVSPWKAILSDQNGYIHDDPEEALRDIFADDDGGEISIRCGTALPTGDGDGDDDEARLPGTYQSHDIFVEFDLQDFDSFEEGIEAWRQAVAAANGLNAMADLERVTAERDHAIAKLAEAEENQRELSKDWARTVREMQAEINELTRAQT